MIRECGEVVASDGDQLLVRAVSRAACPRCAAGQGCGGGFMSWLLRERLEEVRCHAAAPGPAVGERVTLVLPETMLLLAAAIAYLIPILGLIAGALAARLLVGADELAELIGAVLGLLAGMAAARLLARSGPLVQRLRPQVERGDPLAGSSA